MLWVVAHRLDAAGAKERLNVRVVETKQTGDAVERKCATLDEAVYARLGDPEQLGDLIQREQLPSRQRGCRGTDGHNGLGCR